MSDRSAPVGICLSGGGFRSAIYGLGVLRYLAEAQVLTDAAALCGVSGGSVAAVAIGSAVSRTGMVALSAEGFVREVFDPFLQVVTSRDLRNQAVRRWLGAHARLRGQPRNLVLAEGLSQALFPEVDRLADLPERPQLVITATELAAGRAFRFSRAFLGSWDFGYVPPPEDMRTATAVAASTAAPPLLPALQLPTAGLGLRDAPDVLTITDGGVYDNLGVEWFQGWSAARRPAGAVAAEDLIVINASGALDRQDRAFSGPSALSRMRKIQYAQTQATRVRWLVANLEAGRHRGLFFGITADPRRYRLPGPAAAPVEPVCYDGALPSRLIKPLAGLRTDFDRFSTTEATLLAYHGYWSAHARFASLRPETAVRTPRWRQFAGLSDAEAERLERELRGVRHRLGVGERLR